MNRIKRYLYNITFWTSRTITIFVFSICFFAVLNAKYLFSESFFSNLMKIVYSVSEFLTAFLYINSSYTKYIFSLYTDPSPFQFLHLFKYYLCRSFSINSQYIDILVMTFFIITLIYILFKIILKINNKACEIISIFTTYIIVYLITLKADFFFLLILTTIIFILVNILNKYFKNNNRILILIPIIPEIFYFDNIIDKIYIGNYKSLVKSIYILIISIFISNILYICFYFKMKYFIEPIIKSDTYNICVYKNKILVSSNPPYVVDGINNKFLNNKYGYIQDIAYNCNKDEFYVYDVNKAILYILDADSYNTKNTINIENETAVRLFYNEKRYELFATFENVNYYSLIIDLNEYKIIGKYYTENLNDGIIYNKFRQSYLLTFFQKHNFIQEVSVNSFKIKNIPFDSEQGYIAISERNKEVYVAYHQQGRIGVYDAETMELKRKIKSNYTVKDITYDEDLNILIAPSYFTGYVDIFLMDGSDKLLTREFIGYELREARFDYQKENLYIASRKGLYKKAIDIKRLIEKVSHETK